MSGFSAITIIFALIGAALYFGVVWFAGRRGWWWLALLVSLPALFGMIAFSHMSGDVMTESSSLLIRHFGKVGILQLLAGVAVYFFGRPRGRSGTSV